jgi:hypothetical protein
MSDPNYDVLIDFVRAMDDAWYRDATTKTWLVADQAGDLKGAKCTQALAAIAKAGVPGSRTVPLKRDNPELVAGDHSIDERRPVCANIERLAKIRAWEKWAFLSVKESGRIGGGGFYDLAFFEKCVATYDLLLKAGVARTSKVQERELEGPNNTKIKWSGTIEDLRKKWCDIGLKKVQAEIEAKQAPYRKVLKGDKLTMALQTGAFYVAGGTITSDPKKLAAAAVWFSDTQSVNSDRKVCEGGAEIHVVHRYQFDATHKLVKTTDTQYCGNVPMNAYK